MTEEINKYLLEKCREWMLPEEIIALRRISLTENGEEITRKTAHVELKIEQMYGFANEKVNALVRLGKQGMLHKIAERLLKDNGNEIINNCPKCGRLARTPKAKQCRYCGFDWHPILDNK
jgi:hypothetical protein